jgi:hypothetical protein
VWGFSWRHGGYISSPFAPARSYLPLTQGLLHSSGVRRVGHLWSGFPCQRIAPCLSSPHLRTNPPGGFPPTHPKEHAPLPDDLTSLLATRGWFAAPPLLQPCSGVNSAEAEGDNQYLRLAESFVASAPSHGACSLKVWRFLLHDLSHAGSGPALLFSRSAVAHRHCVIAASPRCKTGGGSGPRGPNRLDFLTGVRNRFTTKLRTFLPSEAAV